MAQWSAHWRRFLNEYPIKIVYIVAGECNGRSYPSSRWWTLRPDVPEGLVALRSGAIFAVPRADYSLRRKVVIEDLRVVVRERALGPARRG